MGCVCFIQTTWVHMIEHIYGYTRKTTGNIFQTSNTSPAHFCTLHEEGEEKREDGGEEGGGDKEGEEGREGGGEGKGKGGGEEGGKQRGEGGGGGRIEEGETACFLNVVKCTHYRFKGSKCHNRFGL